MIDSEKKQYVDFLITKPYKLGHALGFTKLTELHNDWMIDMLRGNNDDTLQAHRGSYKTTCVSIVLALIITLLPSKTTMFMRKTDNDVKEIIKQVKNILLNPKFQAFMIKIYGVPVELTVSNSTEISTNLANSTKGTSQLVAIGLGGSLTGKHFDYIFTDDIVNLKDRVSRAERENTKTVYQELHNIKNRGGRIYNTGTPWHKDDCFQLMPKAKVYDCYSTNLIDKDELDEIRKNMVSSLFSANYEMRHVASDDVLFKESPTFFDDVTLLEHGVVHIDGAYGGSDACALTIMKRVDNKYYAFGLKYQGHIDDVLDNWLDIVSKYKGGSIHTEYNADKGYLAKTIKSKGFKAAKPYHEGTNKFIKISGVLKPIWSDIIWYRETNMEYLGDVMEYSEFVAHDDCADSCACAARLLQKVARASLVR